MAVIMSERLATLKRVEFCLLLTFNETKASKHPVATIQLGQNYRFLMVQLKSFLLSSRANVCVELAQGRNW